MYAFFLSQRATQIIFLSPNSPSFPNFLLRSTHKCALSFQCLIMDLLGARESLQSLVCWPNEPGLQNLKHLLQTIPTHSPFSAWKVNAVSPLCKSPSLCPWGIFHHQYDRAPASSYWLWCCCLRYHLTWLKGIMYLTNIVIQSAEQFHGGCRCSEAEQKIWGSDIVVFWGLTQNLNII